MTPQDDAANALESFAAGPAFDAADATARAFEAAGERISNALEQAALSGEFSFNSLAESIAQDFARVAINDLIINPLQSLVGGAISGATGGGNSQGSGRPVTVNMNLSGVSNPASFQRSQGQISAALARAVSDGQRYL